MNGGEDTGRRRSARPASFKALVPPAVPALVVPPSDSRRSLTFYPSSLGTVTWSTQVIPANGIGFTMGTGAAPFTLTLEVHGTIVQQGWWAWSNPNTTPAVWSEAMD